ncbi:hypothetical protein L2E82_02613 [Cichorium intybus]|uniref:Uncharacterized protein n=1 Tax=Cichorium intybus TaxID=13427 RepID=A0ACB9H240_CICIN|nr:hypothetical protein L2E82_02613 [Cichorium intybus]
MQIKQLLSDAIPMKSLDLSFFCLYDSLNLAPNNAKFTAISPRQGTPANSPLLDQLAMDVEQGVREAENKIGSNPPSCEHKCYGCIPCDATQVPAIGGYVGVAVQYSNYEPEDWKCYLLKELSDTFLLLTMKNPLVLHAYT